MKKFAILLGLMLCLNLTAQNVNLNDPLPVNTKIKKGVLSNGMTYYIYNTDVTNDVASFYIIQNVGSVLENDNQQGLAHFLEHMAFNGTENFEGKGVLNTLQKVGAVFGKNINAYTSFDETVYNMDNIPTTPEMIDTCLLILHDWSNHLLLTEEEIDAERGVIKEEWRQRQSGRMRIFQQSIGTMFNNSKYSERMPIGLMDIVDNFEYKALRDFYHDWYRTDLQAIAIVGDIDVAEIENKIKALFSDIPAVKNPIERKIYQINDNKDILYNMAMDEEVSTASISFSINHPKSLKDQTVADLNESLMNAMTTMMLSARLSEIAQKPEATFLGARVGFSSFARAKNQFSVGITPKPAMQQVAFKDVMEEVNRAVKFGFTQAEIDRTIKQYTNFYETQISKEADQPHANIINTIKKNYLENETMTDVSKEYELAKAIFASITPADFHNTINKLYTKENRVLTVTGVQGENNLTEDDALSIIGAVENDATLEAYADEFGDKSLMDGVNLKPGKIVKEELNKVTGATTFTLSNGAKVHYKFVDKNKNDVQLIASSYGGTTKLKDSELPSANMVQNLVGSSGLGVYSAADLRKVLAGKTANTLVILTALEETIAGSAVTKDVETMLQMVHLRFEKPRFDEDAYKVLQNNITNSLTRRSKDIGAKMQDSLTVTLYGHNNPKKRLFNEDMVKDVSFEGIKQVYTSRFNNAADFDFIIVGDIKKETLKPLLEKYIASISSTKVKEDWSKEKEEWINNKIDTDIMLQMEDPKATVRIGYKNDMEYTLKNDLLAQTLGAILQLRYTETLREQEGGTYGASARANATKKPVEEATITVSFDCNPDKVETLIGIVHAEINKVANGEIQQIDLDKTLANYLKERKEQKDYNRYDMSWVSNYVREGYDMNNPMNFEDIVNSITAKDIQKFTKKIMENAKTFEVVFKPENQ